ncbi:MAG: hypothetical protein H7336_16060, partial [Bacteriovorax sp.]|nr:hypothetical protein [Bacteriovorax sp.]
AFDMIERGGSYYIKKPAPAVAAPQIQAPIQQRKQQQPPVQKPQQEKTFTVETLKPGQQQGVEEQVSIEDRINFHDQKKIPTTQTGKTKNAKVDERLIEINQNLAFYCMKHRKDLAFGGDEAKCMSFVNHTMNACQKIHHIVNSKLLSCIQAKLKSRQ